MSTVRRSARGASAFTQPDPSFCFPADQVGLVCLGIEDVSTYAWTQLIGELLRLRNLDDDWDGEGSAAPHPALVDAAITLAQDLEARGEPPADRVIASVNGTIYFEWHTPLGYQEIEVTSPLDAECRWVQKGTDRTVVASLSRRP